MTDSKTAATPNNAIAALFAEQLSLVFENMTGDKPNCAPAEPRQLSAEGPVLTWKQEFNVTTLNAAWLAIDRSAAASLGFRMLKAAGLEEQDEATACSTYIELLNQALSGLSRVLGVRAKREISCVGGKEAAPPDGLEFIPLNIGFPDGNFTLLVHFSESAAVVPQPQPQIPETEPPSLLPVDTSVHVEKSKTLDLLLDVELPVSISFGRAQMPLKDVVKLTTGSIIELNRTLSEPVELIVNNCVIARGEVVVVEGNFGIRIHQVASRQDRLRTVL